jgi:sirohydrochlorin ferrochelatase
MSTRLMLAVAFATSLLAAPAAAQDGILLLAHGGRAQWNDNVNALAASLDAEMPVEVAFGMATRAAIQGAVDRLVARGVARIVAVPLFVSSHSTVITSTEFLLGLRRERPAALERFAKMSHGHGGGHDGDHGAGPDPRALDPVVSPVPIVMTAALNAHPLVAEILASRASSLSTDPASEAVVLVAHGPVSDEDNARWLADMETLAAQIDSKTSFASIDWLTVRDDAPKPVKDRATAELRDLVARRAAGGRRVLVVPLLLTFGGIEQGIRERLAGLDYTMASQGLLPDDRLREWVRLSAASHGGTRGPDVPASRSTPATHDH